MSGRISPEEIATVDRRIVEERILVLNRTQARVAKVASALNDEVIEMAREVAELHAELARRGVV